MINEQFDFITKNSKTSTEIRKIEKENIIKTFNEIQAQFNEAHNELLLLTKNTKKEKERSHINLIDGINSEFNKIFSLVYFNFI